MVEAADINQAAPPAPQEQVAVETATSTVTVTGAAPMTVDVQARPEADTGLIAAHEQVMHLLIREFYPDHTPRESDPHKVYFDRARKRLKDLGRLKCWICGTTENIQLHHTMVEEALKNGVDVTKFEELYPEFGITTDEQFLEWVEGSENNLTALCFSHHIGILGIHFLPYPSWVSQRWWKQGEEVPGMVVRAPK